MINGIIQKISGNKCSSREQAKKRLQLALVYDQLEVSDSVLGDLKSDLLDVITKYFVVEQNSLQMDIGRKNENSSLVLDIPIISSRRRAAV